MGNFHVGQARRGLYSGNRVRSAAPPSRERLFGMQDESLELPDSVPITQRTASSSASRGRGFTVANFSVVRPLFQTDELAAYHAEVSDYFSGKQFKVRKLERWALQIVPRRDFVYSFIDADVQPDPRDVYVASRSVVSSVRKVVKGLERKITMDPGDIGTFTQERRTIGLGSLGWMGFRQDYPRKNSDNTANVNHYLRAEASVAVGDVVQTLSNGIDSTGNPTQVNFGRLFGLTPHIAMADKRGQQPVTAREAEKISHDLRELGPPPIELYDPVIDYDIGTSDALLDLGGEIVKVPGYDTVRRPKTRDFNNLTVLPF